MVVVIRNTFHSIHTSGLGFGARPLNYDEVGSVRRVVTSVRKPAVVSNFHANSNRSTDLESPIFSPVKMKMGGFNRTLLNERRISFKKNSALETLGAISPSRRQTGKRRKVTLASTSEPTHHVSVVLIPVQKTVAVLTKASSDLTRRTSKFLEVVEESHRQATKKKRISQCLIGLRAASERSLDIQSYASERSEPSPLKALVGEVGLALFSPLDPEAFEKPQDDDVSTLSDAVLDEEAIVYPVNIEVEPSWLLASCPQLLTPIMIQQLMDQALPAAVTTMQWRRIFALGRDGDSLQTMLYHCNGYSNTLLLIETAKGDVIGGFAASPWNGGEKSSKSGSEFYGNGQSFLFSSHSNDLNQKDPFCIYKWTGKNSYCQYCNGRQLAMGGGGAFGLIVNESFSRGTTGRCSTFGNEPLVPDLGGTFEVMNFEVYGFKSLAESYRGTYLI